MKVRTFPNLASANAYLSSRASDVYLHQHREGVGPDDFRITNPGNAAARLRATPIRTERTLLVLLDAAATNCVPVPAVVTPASGTRLTHVPRSVVPGNDPLAVDFNDGRGGWASRARRE